MQRHVPFTLHASVTRVGEREPAAGFSITHEGGEVGDPRQTLRLPDGEYVVTADWTFTRKDRELSAVRDERPEEGRVGEQGGAKEDETSRVERVTLTGGEIIVPLASRARE